LPVEWIRNYDLKAGDELDINDKGTPTKNNNKIMIIIGIIPFLDTTLSIPLCIQYTNEPNPNIIIKYKIPPTIIETNKDDKTIRENAKVKIDENISPAGTFMSLMNNVIKIVARSPINIGKKELKFFDQLLMNSL